MIITEQNNKFVVSAGDWLQTFRVAVAANIFKYFYI